MRHLGWMTFSLLLIIAVGSVAYQTSTEQPGHQETANLPPIADCGGDVSARLGIPVQFDGSRSFDPDSTLGWAWGTPLPTARRSLGVVAVDSEILAIGGGLWNEDNTQIVMSNITERFDPVADAWQNATPIPLPKEQIDPAVSEGTVFVSGNGWATEGYNSTEIYDPVADTWRIGTPLPEGGRTNLEVVGGRLLAIGSQSKKVFVYNKSTEDWSLLSTLPIDISHFGTGTNGELLYIFGGGNASGPSRAAFSYDLNEATWARVADMPTARIDLAAQFFRSRFHVIGGQLSSDNDVLNVHEIFDPQNNSWVIGKPLQISRDELGLAVLGDSLYAIGGKNWYLGGPLDVVEVFSAFLTYEWDFGDGSYGYGIYAEHTYKAEGAYVVELTVRDPEGAEGLDRCTVTIGNEMHQIALDIDPDTLNLKSKGRWITAYLSAENASVHDMNVSTILLQDALAPERWDYQGDILMLKFNRQALIAILEVGESAEIKLTGKWKDGSDFEEYDYIRVICP